MNISDSTEWRAYCDGGSRGNPGPAACGVVICDPSGRAVKDVRFLIGVNTNQVAEYEALIRALKELREAGARRARVFTDSEFVVKQFNGIYKIRDERMKALMARVREVQSDFESVEVVHIRRSSHPHNVRADALVNQALDEEAAPGKNPGAARPSLF
jgi:ribonuclease HI